MQNIVIYKRTSPSDPEGTPRAVLYDGPAKTRKAFVERLVRDGRSLAGADLAGADLSFLDLSGADFCGAMLDRAQLRGSFLQDACFKEASMREARMHGAHAERAVFQGADLSDAHLQGAILTFSNFRGAVLDKADLTEASCSSTVFTYINANDACFRNARMLNADFGNSRIVHSDFRGCDLRPSGPVDERHLPDRTRNAIVVGCKFDDETHLCDSLKAMSRDRKAVKLSSAALWSATTMALFGVGTQIPDVVDDQEIRKLAGQGVGLIAVFTAAYLLREGFDDFMREVVQKRLSAAQIRIREAADELARNGAGWKNLAVAMIRERSMVKPLARALRSTAPEARKTGAAAAFKIVAGDIGNVIVCDRRHLALALGAICANRRRTYHLSRDIVLLRSPLSEEAAPSCIRFLKDGRTCAVWTKDGVPCRSETYGVNGIMEASWSREGLDDGRQRTANAEQAMLSFEAAILSEHGLDEFSYPRDSHYVDAGKDGSVLVHRVADRRVDNPDGPALIKPDGEQVRYAYGRKREDDGLAPWM